MDRINHLNKIKEYEKQIKQKCKMHRQVSYGYMTTDNPVKRQVAKSIIQQQPIREKSLGLARERVQDPYMYSIQLAQNRQLNDYIFKNPDIFLTNIKTEEEVRRQTIPGEGELSQELLDQGWQVVIDEKGKKVYVNPNTMATQEEYPTLTHHQTPSNVRPLTEELISQGWVIAKNAYNESIYFNTVYDVETFAYPSTEQTTQIEEELSQQTEQELTPELLADGWRRIEDPITKNYMYINIQQGGVPQTEYPTIARTVPVGRPQLTLYTSRGQTYYVNMATGAVTRTLPSGFTQADVITSSITEPEESQRFINYYKPKFNTRVRGDRVIPDSGLRDALRNDINKIYSNPTVLNFFNDYRYLLNKDVLESGSRKELVKQYKSILNIIAQHDTEMPRNFEPFLSLTQEFNKARRDESAVNVNHNDEIEQSTQSGDSVEFDKYDYIRLREQIREMLKAGANEDGEPLTQQEIDKLNERIQTIKDHESYAIMLQTLKDDLASGVASDGVTPLTQEQIDIFNQRIAELEEQLRNIDQQLESIQSDVTDLRPQTQLERYNQIIQRYQDKLENGVNENGQPMTTKERNMYKSQIIMLQRMVTDIQQSTPAEPTEEERNIEENIQHPSVPPDPTVPEKAPTQEQPTQQIPGG